LLSGGFFPNNVILNLKEEASFTQIGEGVEFESQQRIAQVVDGQHRIEGLKEAIKQDETIGNLKIPAVLCNNLSTEECAQIFVSINTEQKPVAKSLIYDLYGLMNISAADFSIDRGTDIAKALNNDENSPYQGQIKLPGSRKFKGGIQLSSVVTSLKPLVKKDGEFEKYNITTLDYQIAAIKNYFNAIQYYYGEEWDKLNNPFLFASGFGAAIEVLTTKILPACYAARNFTDAHIRTYLSIPKDMLIKQSEVKGMSGETAKAQIRDQLTKCILSAHASESEFKI